MLGSLTGFISCPSERFRVGADGSCTQTSPNFLVLSLSRVFFGHLVQTPMMVGPQAEEAG